MTNPERLNVLSGALDTVKRAISDTLRPSSRSDEMTITPAVDAKWYAEQYPESSKSGMRAAVHYLRAGTAARLNPNPYFDTDWYLRENPDVDENKINPLKHYLVFGAAEGRDPCARFSTIAYLRRYRDVARVRQNPLVHFLNNGILEGRSVDGDDGIWFKIDASVQLLNEDAAQPAAKQITLMLMQHHIEPDGRPFGYRSTGSDPQLFIEEKVPAGFFRVRLNISYNGIAKSLAECSSVQIFIGDEDGFRVGNSWTYAVNNGSVYIDDLLFNEKDIVCFRLDPLDTVGSLCIEYFEITPVPVYSGVKEIISRSKIAELDGASIRSYLAKKSLPKLVKRLSSSEPDVGDPYQKWIAARTLVLSDRIRLKRNVSRMKTLPKFSILMPVYRSNIDLLDRAIGSIHEQIYSNWELCVVDDGSGVPELCTSLQGWVKRDRRIKFKAQPQNAGISAATNVALQMATGSFIALVDHDDEIAPHALYAAALALNRDPDADMLYTDEDKIDIDGNRFGPLFKPDWSPEFFLGCMYTCHLGIYRLSLVRELGGFRPAFDLAQDYDLALRVSAVARKIIHIPDILYHWRITENSTAGGADGKPTAELAARRAVQSAIEDEGLSGIVYQGPFRGSHRVQLNLNERPLISLVIPTAARRIDPKTERWYLLDLLESINQSTYPYIEFVIVHNGDIEPALSKSLEKFRPYLVHYKSEVFNIADKMNFGVESARGDYTVLLNDDMTVITNDWLEKMLMWFLRKGVVCVGAKLLFPSDTIQHAGVLLLGQGPSHVYYGSGVEEPGLVGSAVLARNYSAVTGACLMVRRKDYISCGGFDPYFRVNYNDVDFCLRLRKMGRIVYEPNAVLYHYESVSKDESPADELSSFNDRWESLVGKDPYYNLNLSQRSSLNEVTLRPRTLAQDYP